MYDMNRQAEGSEHFQCARCHDIAAMQHSPCAGRQRLAHRRFQQVPVVMAVGDDADFHDDVESRMRCKNSREL